MALVALNFEESPRQALIRGIAKGMGAPLMLFAASGAAAQAISIPDLPKVPAVRSPRALLVLTDMQRLGLDFNAAVGRYEQQQEKQKSAAG